MNVKFSGNPAANCGLRIFALKKMLDFLSTQIADHEHAFEGTIMDKRNIVKCLLEKIKSLNDSIVPDGLIKHLATASNKSHKKALMEQMEKCPERSLKSIMNGVKNYANSVEFNHEKTLLMELGCKKIRIPGVKEYMNSTNWLLEQLVCLGGNRPCALLGITVKEWIDRQPGYCPFFQDDENEMVEDDPKHDSRKILKDPYHKPSGSTADKPTGVIVKSETDKITVGAPCYIWFPNALVDLVNAHSLMAQKILPRSVDLHHPNTRLFLNSNGKEITKIPCTHLKNFIGLPITAYDFRRSLSTFCLDSKNENIRKAEPDVLRHKEATGYAYYFQKHGDRVEYVSIQYALKQGLIKADDESVNKYCETLKNGAKDDEWELVQMRTDKALEYGQQLLKNRKKNLNDARHKGGRTWILPQEYEDFVQGVEEAIFIEENRKLAGQGPGSFANLLKYKPQADGGGAFPPVAIWKIDMYRVLYGLSGDKGDIMREAELSVYNGVPFSKVSGRKKITQAIEKRKKDKDLVVATYWYEKIRSEARQIFSGKWMPLRFIFNEKDLHYHNSFQRKKIKTEA